jgi:tripartite-type tricarboxylate transporter receptor subunit TctC
LGIATVSTVASNPAINPKTPYNPLTDFTPIINIAATPNVIAVHPSFPAKDYKGFVAELKKHPGQYSYSSSGTGGIGHMQMELYKNLVGVYVIHIPYRGGTGPITDLLGGQVDVLVDTQTVTLPHIASGAIRGLGVTSPEEWPSLKGIPPVGKTVKGYDVRSWMGVAAPKGLPQPILEKLNAEIRYVAGRDPAKGKLEQLGNEVRASSPQEMHDWVANEVAKWRKVVADAKIPQQ